MKVYNVIKRDDAVNCDCVLAVFTTKEDAEKLIEKYCESAGWKVWEDGNCFKCGLGELVKGFGRGRIGIEAADVLESFNEYRFKC